MPDGSLASSRDAHAPDMTFAAHGAVAGIERGGFVLVTLHRPSNVDDHATLAGIFEALRTMAQDVPVVFPMHPRTRKQAQAFGLGLDGVAVLDPVGYREILALQARSGLVVTDSGGVQEEVVDAAGFIAQAAWGRA